MESSVKMSEWFVEEDNKEIRFSCKIDKTLFEGKSDYQDVKVVNTLAYGKMLILDGCVMLTETDEFVYHELISHVPLCYHKNPRNVLVIGGGDGGTVREVLKHKEVEKVVLCEIDKMVVDVSKKFFPEVAGELDNKRAEVFIGDGIDYIARHENAFDIILVDSTDPVGPGEGLFTKDFYKSVSRALRPGGIVALQSESPWFRKPFLERIQNNVAGAFEHKKAYIGPVTTYPRGLWSWTMASHDATLFDAPNLERFRAVSKGLKYLTEGMLTTVFDIPAFFKEKINS